MSKADIGKSSLSEYVRARIKTAIYEGKLEPGSRVRESEICNWLKVSRTPVREAMMHLIAEGFLVAVPARGTVVNQLDRSQVIELYAIRGSLEALAARLATKFMGEADLNFLEELTSRSEKAMGNPKRQAELNRTFHETVHTASHNRYMASMVNSLQSSIALLTGTTYSVEGRAVQAHAEHRAIIDAFRRGDADAAAKHSEAHLRAAEVARLSLFNANL